MPATADHRIESTRGDLGRGVYALGDLRTYVAVNGDPKDARSVRTWLTRVLNPVGHRPWGSDYSFSDLVSLFVVRELIRRGVSPQKVREAEAWMRVEAAIDRPFVIEDVKTDGVEVFFRDEVVPSQIEAASRRGQQTMRALVKDRLTTVHYEGGHAAYWTPSPGIVVDPRVQFGAPVVEGTRVPTDAIYGVVSQLGVERAIRRFDLSAERVKDAIAFEDRIASLN